MHSQDYSEWFGNLRSACHRKIDQEIVQCLAEYPGPNELIDELIQYINNTVGYVPVTHWYSERDEYTTNAVDSIIEGYDHETRGAPLSGYVFFSEELVRVYHETEKTVKFTLLRALLPIRYSVFDRYFAGPMSREMSELIMALREVLSAWTIFILEESEENRLEVYSLAMTANNILKNNDKVSHRPNRDLLVQASFVIMDGSQLKTLSHAAQAHHLIDKTKTQPEALADLKKQVDVNIYRKIPVSPLFLPKGFKYELQ